MPKNTDCLLFRSGINVSVEMCLVLLKSDETGVFRKTLHMKTIVWYLANIQV